MIAYASRTGTKRNLAGLRAAGWRLLVSATGVWRNEGFPYALDNGAWTAHQQEKPFDVAKFEGVVEKLGEGADWVVLPDIVGGGMGSLDFSMRWRGKMPCPELLAVQDGMEPADVRELVGPDLGIFLGGTTDFKLDSMPWWGDLARERRAYFHVGRVNTRRRIRLCKDAGADSFDGTAASRFAVELSKLAAETDQGYFDWRSNA